MKVDPSHTLNLNELFAHIKSTQYLAQIDLILPSLARHLLNQGIKGKHNKVISEESDYTEVTFSFGDVPILYTKITSKGCTIEPLICKVKNTDPEDKAQIVTINTNNHNNSR